MALRNFRVKSSYWNPIWVQQQDEEAVQVLAEAHPDSIYFADEEPEPIRLVMRLSAGDQAPKISHWIEDVVQDLAEDFPGENFFFVDVAGADV